MNALWYFPSQLLQSSNCPYAISPHSCYSPVTAHMSFPLQLLQSSHCPYAISPTAVTVQSLPICHFPSQLLQSSHCPYAISPHSCYSPITAHMPFPLTAVTVQSLPICHFSYSCYSPVTAHMIFPLTSSFEYDLFFTLHKQKLARDSSVVTVWTVRGSNPCRGEILPFAQMDPGARPACCTWGTVSLFPGDKAAGAWR